MNIFSADSNVFLGGADSNLSVVTVVLILFILYM